MSFLAKQHRKFEKGVVGGYDELNKKLHELIDEVRWSKRFPDDAEEFLCGYQAYDARGPFPLLKVREEYLLTKDGIKYARRGKLMTEKPTLTIKKKPTKEFIVKTIPIMTITEREPLSFGTICNNLQKIIDKYEIEIDWEKYGKRSKLRGFQKFLKSLFPK